MKQTLFMSVCLLMATKANAFTLELDNGYMFGPGDVIHLDNGYKE